MFQGTKATGVIKVKVQEEREVCFRENITTVLRKSLGDISERLYG